MARSGAGAARTVTNPRRTRAVCRPRRGLALPARGGSAMIGDERAAARVARRAATGRRLDVQLALAVVAIAWAARASARTG